MSNALPKVVRRIGSKLPKSQIIWLKRFRRQEHPWQRGQRTLREHLDKVAGATDKGLTTGTTIPNFRGAPATIVTRGYDALQAVTHNVNQVGQALREQGIEFVRLPGITAFNPLLVVKLEDTARTVEALTSLSEEDGWSVRLENNRRRPLSQNSGVRHPELVYRIQVSRPIIGPSGYLMSTDRETVVIETWQTMAGGEKRVDGSTHLPGTVARRLPSRGPLVEYLAPDTWAKAIRENNHTLTWQTPHLYQVKEPIDVVYTWVDGDDPAWQARKRKASGQLDLNSVNETALSESRFTSRDELKYSLRSLEAYANWVNHIYIVTDNQVPEWLNTDHPKITVIDHKEIFKDPSVLPVFNSHAIESQLHHIPGLNERYLYMNDDLFFMRPVTPELFFTSNGLSKFFPSKAPLDIHEASARDLPVLSAAKHGRAFMQENYGRTVTNKFKHTPHPQLRSVLEELEAEHPAMFEAVAASTFRDPNDYSIASALYHFYAYAKQKAVVGEISYDYLDIGSDKAALRLEWFSYQDSLDVVCLNDTHIEADEQDRVADLLGDFLERRFPIESSFER